MIRSTRTSANTQVSEEQLKSMLLHTFRIQDKLNRAIDPNWLKTERPWHRKALIEAVKLTDHCEWKWWKKETTNIAQVHLAMTDIWGSVISGMLVDRHIPYEVNELVEWEVETLAGKLSELYTDAVTLKEPCGDISELRLSFIETFIESAITGRFHGGDTLVDAFFDVMKVFGLNITRLYTLYIGKSVLDIFRQNNGYAEGKYQSTWGDREDTEVAMIITRRLAIESDGVIDPQDLNNELELVYAEILAE